VHLPLLEQLMIMYCGNFAPWTASEQQLAQVRAMTHLKDVKVAAPVMLALLKQQAAAVKAAAVARAVAPAAAAALAADASAAGPSESVSAVMPVLRWEHVQYSDFTSETLRLLQHLPNLRTLAGVWRVTDRSSGGFRLSSFPQLTTLDLMLAEDPDDDEPDESVTEALVDALTAGGEINTSVTTLFLTNGSLSSADLSLVLSNFASLTEVSLDRVGSLAFCSSAGAAHLARSLTKLTLYNHRSVAAAEFAHLSALVELRDLTISLASDVFEEEGAEEEVIERYQPLSVLAPKLVKFAIF
jgi:hypothetical protein